MSAFPPASFTAQTRFSPSREDSSKPPRKPPTSKTDDSSALDFSVLIVDDREDSRYVYERYFSFRGARAKTAADGVAALASVALEPPDVIVLDLAMPRMTGWEVLERLKADARTRHIPVLVLSGQMERESAIRCGADAYCDKPCPPDRLLDQVVRLIRRSQG